MELDLVFTNRS